MAQQLSSGQVWSEIEKELFAVLGMVTAKGEARTMGIVYIVNNKKLYVSTKKDSWPTRHTQNNPRVSMTIPIAKRILLMPWIKIPQATITFSGMAKVFEAKILKTKSYMLSSADLNQIQKSCQPCLYWKLNQRENLSPTVLESP